MNFNQAFDEHGVDVVHHFSSGVYAKETRIPAGVELEQHAHCYDHMSVLASGTAEVHAEGIHLYRAPEVIHMRAGIKHKVVAMTDVIWLCIHKTDETDPDKIDEAIIEDHAAG